MRHSHEGPTWAELAEDQARALVGEPSFIEVSLADLMTKTEQDQHYVIRPFLPCGHVTMMGAHGGAGKSVLALTWAAHSAAEAGWEGSKISGGRTVFLSLEDGGDMIRRRLRRIVTKFNLDVTRLTQNLIVLDGTNTDGVLARDAIAPGMRVFGPTQAFDKLSRVATGARLIVVDNASDAFDGNENERRIVRQFVRMLAQLAQDNGASVLLLAHIDKAAARDGGKRNTYSGSTAWHNSARSRIALITDEYGAVTLVHEKHNLGRLANPIELRWDESGLLTVDKTEQVSTGRNMEQLHADADAVLNALRAAAAADVNVPSARVGAHTARHALAACGLPKGLSEKSGNRRFWSAVDFLLAEKCAKREKHTTGQRKERERIVPLERAPKECADISPITPDALGAPRGAPCAQSAPNPLGAHSAQLGADDEKECSAAEYKKARGRE